MSVAERPKVTVVELVYEAPLLMLTEPDGAVVSIGGDSNVRVTVCPAPRLPVNSVV